MRRDNDDESESPNPYGAPLWIAAAVFVLILVLVGGFLLLTGGGDDSEDTNTNPGPTATAAPTPAPSSVKNGSTCGLEPNTADRSVKVGPKAEWEYIDFTAYPVSKTYGPAETTDDGFRECFQQSPEGALFYAAYNVAEQMSQPDTMTNEGYRDHVRAWVEFAASEGTYRDQLTTITAENFDVDPIAMGTWRTSTTGFRILMFTGDEAVVDILTTDQRNGQQTYTSNSFSLVWQAGDWKLNTNVERPVNSARLSSPVGYANWGEQTGLPIGHDE